MVNISLQEVVELPDYNKITFKENPAIPLDDIVPDASPQAVDLLQKFLVYPSKQRCSARQVTSKSWSLNLCGFWGLFLAGFCPISEANAFLVE